MINTSVHINFECTSEIDQSIEFELLANKNSPICNLSLVIKNLDSIPASLEVDGVKKVLNKDYFVSYQPTLAGNEMVIWLYLKSEKTTKIKIS